MIQGTMSGVGKSVLTAGLCRLFHQAGLRVAPFKSQNMALNSFITREGLEMGRAQVVQAEACGLEPSVLMNPILLKPTSDKGSQVIVKGEVLGDYDAEKYYAMKKQLRPTVLEAYEKLSSQYDLIVVEGAGSPAEINLKADDFVNMGLARELNIPVLLAGDIDRGGVFAQLVGTLALLTTEEQDLVKATVINKFRGDLEILRPGLAELERLTGKPVAGVVPWIDADIDDEDSLSDRFGRVTPDAVIDIAVIRLPRIANFSDFSSLSALPGVSLRYAGRREDLKNPDLIVIPGSKNTIGDMAWLRQQGLEAAVKKLVSRGTPLIGICGGYQMLGREIIDDEGAEGGGSIAGMNLLPVHTRFRPEKRRTRTTAQTLKLDGIFSPLSGLELEGYEIHCGITQRDADSPALIRLEDGTLDGCQRGNVYGCYLHGFFDSEGCRTSVVKTLAQKKGLNLTVPSFDWKAYKERQYDLLAQSLRQSLNLNLISEILNVPAGTL